MSIGVLSGKQAPRTPRVKVIVTQEMIEEAKQRDSSHCMLAEAMRVAMPGARFVGIDVQTIRFTDPARPLRYVYLTPRVAQEAIIALDQGDDIPELEFELRGGQVLSYEKSTP